MSGGQVLQPLINYRNAQAQQRGSGLLDYATPEEIEQWRRAGDLAVNWATAVAPLGMVKVGPGMSWLEILEKQREVEGLRAAMRDPETGKIYTGRSHQSAIETTPKGDGSWGRLYSEWDRGTSNTGFLDREGNFISRDAAEKLLGVSTMEDVRDFLKKKPWER